MYPVFFRLGDLAIHTYGVLVALGFAAGLWLAARRARVAGLDPEVIHRLGVWLIVAGIAGAKLFYITFFWPDFSGGWRAAGVASLREGFVFYGGFIGAMGATILYARARRLPLWSLADTLAPAVALGHAFGRLGCFANGCCFGGVCRWPWAVSFPEPHLLAGIPVHPTQLYETAGNLIICAGLLARRRGNHPPGQLWWLYVLSYGILRFGIEFLRGDYESRLAGLVSVSQLVALGLIVVAAFALHRMCRRRACSLRGPAISSDRR